MDEDQPLPSGVSLGEKPGAPLTAPLSCPGLVACGRDARATLGAALGSERLFASQGWQSWQHWRQPLGPGLAPAWLAQGSREREGRALSLPEQPASQPGLKST